MAIHRPLCPAGSEAHELPDATPCAESNRPFVLAATILASSMGFIDSSIVNIALPAIQADFGTGFSTLQWVVNAYALMLGGLILLGGGAGDALGRNRIFMAGIAVFALASIFCALAPNAAALIAARAVQGIGAALLIPQSLAIIAATFPKEVRGRAIGLWAGASAITTALGPPLGGLLVDFLDWRAVFWINLPVSAASLWLAYRYIPESRSKNMTRSLDWQGAVLAVAGFGALTLALTTATDTQQLSALAIFLFCAGIFGVTLFVYVERRVRQPLVPLTLFGNKAFTGANLTTLFLYGAFTAILFLLPFDLIERRNFSAFEVGLVLFPVGIVIGVFSRFSGRWADANGPRWPLVLGSATVGAAAALFAFGFENIFAGVALPVLVMSLGMAAVVAPLTTAVMNAAPDEQSGAASGVNNAASRLASLFAVAIAGSLATVIFFNGLEAQGFDAQAPGGAVRFGVLPETGEPLRPVLENAFLQAYTAAMLIAAAWCALAALTAYLTIDGGKRGAT